MSLGDGARVVVLRSRAILALAGRGGMVSVAEAADHVRDRIARWGGRVSVAAVNGPEVTVVSGEPEALDELVAVCEADGVRVRRVPVDYASHSAQVERIRDEIVTALAPIRSRPGRVPLVSTLTGETTDGSGMDADYWYRNLRGTVEFQGAVETLTDTGHGLFVECSPHPVLVMAIQQTAEDAVAIGTLRRDEGGARRLLLSVAEAHARGASVDWRAVTGPAAHLDLPTYAFQRRRHRLPATRGAGDVAAAGLTAPGHPLLGAVVERADGDGLVVTGRLSRTAHPWLAEHSVHGSVLLPGTAFLDVVLHVAGLVGAGRVDELTLAAPLVLPERDGVRVQVVVGAADDTGARAVEVHSRPDAGEWTRHATGVLAAAPAPADPGDLAGVWPPAGALPLAVDDFYAGFAERGYGHGPSFQGLRAAWRRGDEVFAEVRLPEERVGEAAAYGVHPALLDAASHTLALLGDRADQGSAHLPFAWTGVTLHASGATALRVRVAPAGGDAVALAVADTAGTPVAEVEALVVRPVTADRVRVPEPLHAVAWRPLRPAGTPAAPPTAVLPAGGDLADLADPVPEVVVAEVAPPGAGLPADAHATAHRALGLVRGWLADDRFADARLVVVTRGAVATGSGAAPDPAVAPVWGLVRTAQTEHPDRFVLLDVDGDLPPAAPAAAVRSGEPQLALRAGEWFAPRLTRATPGERVVLGAGGAVLVTGAMGTLGGHVARHLVTAHGVRDLVLAGRRGADGAAGLVDELTGLGARVRVARCDVGDRAEVAALLAGIPDLVAVVHVAGVVDDGVVEGLSVGQVDAVMRPKVD
ncbi:SDR family NAD(P)-dependent oxidoreductase, partial [Saccharothrix syringae]|uniref:SDR family NAD(P)-dependent oxidoreductase n=1 Tax=Saccharothrix syringae TaxID=103733 RepID=UPI0024AE072B